MIRAVLILALIFATPARADDAAASEVVTRYVAAANTLAFRDGFALMPPKVLDTMAQALGRDRDGVLDQLAARSTGDLAHLLLQATRLVPGSLAAAQTPDGTEYFAAELAVFMRLDDLNLIRLSAPHLVLQDGDQWYVARVQTVMDLTVLRRAYPAFADVTFKSAIGQRVTDNIVPATEPPAPQTGASP